MCMGGSKKKSPSQQEKSQTGNTKSDKKSKKSKGKEGSSQRAEITVTLTDEQAGKVIKGSKVITVYELSKQAGVKASAANAYLRKACDAGTLRRAGGHSGHWIYAPISSVNTSPDSSESSSSA